VSKK
jgi:hypothetical protein